MNRNPELCDELPLGDEFIEQFEAYAKEHAVPISGTFELTPRCNFNCNMCYVHIAENRIHKSAVSLTQANG